MLLSLRCLILFILLLVTDVHTIHSQELTILKGYVKNKDGIPIENISILVSQNETIIVYSYTKRDGSFNLEIPAYGDFKIKISGLGFKTYEENIKLENKTTKNFNFVLIEKIEKLEEVILESWQKIKINKDTVTFRASEFKIGSEQVVEDLLRNIPGVEISNDGNIKVNGRAIDKLLIEGDDLYSDKYKLLSKNLDAKNIDEIQILNNFEDNPILKKFQDSEKVAINLKLNKKNILFGNVNLGVGTSNRYSNSSNIGLLKKKIKLFNLTNINNIGQLGISQVQNAETLNFSGINSNKKIEKSNKEIINIDDITNSSFSNNEDIFNKSFLTSLGFTSKVLNNIKLRSLTYFVRDKLIKENVSQIEYFIPPNIINFTEDKNINIDDEFFGTELELKYLSENNTYYNYNFNFERNPRILQGKLILNNNPIDQNQRTNNYSFINHLNITKQLKNNKILLLYAYLGSNRTTQSYNVKPNIFNNLFKDTISGAASQNLNTPQKYYGIVSEVIKKNKISEYGLEFSVKRDEDKITSTFNLENQPKIDSLFNNTFYNNTKLDLMVKYSIDLSKFFKFRSFITLTQNHYTLNGTDGKLFTINPNFRLHTKKTKLGNFGVGYNYQNRLPPIEYLNKNFILRNYRTFSRGVDDIAQLKNHNFSFFYTFNDYKKQFLINSFLIHSFSNKTYGFLSSINQNVSFNQYTILEGGQTTNFSFSGTKYFESLSSTLKISTQHSWNQKEVIINNVNDQLNNYNSFYKFQGTTYFKIPFNFKFNFQYNYLTGNFNNENTSNSYINSSLNTFFKISKEWFASLNNTYYQINDRDFLFTNVKIDYNPEKSRFSFSLNSNNLINTTKYSNVFISEFQRNESSFRILPRYFLLNVKYRF